MSTDYTVLCDKCQLYLHAGQRFTSGFSFGYGKDDLEGQDALKDFLVEHGFCNSKGLRLVLTDYIPTDYKNQEKL